MAPPTLLAVPNVSEGRDTARIATLEAIFSRGVSLLDRHSDPDHNRTVFTLAGDPEALVAALAGGAAAAVETIDMRTHEGVHPAIGALDVCPLVWLDPGDRDVAGSRAGEAAERIGALGIPVFLYGALASGPEHAERAYFRNGGLAELWLRMEAGELRPDFGPELPHRTGGATLVTARPPLAAFNVELDAPLDHAKHVAATIREGGAEGLPGVRALGLHLHEQDVVQVSTNIEDLTRTTPADVVRAVQRHATVTRAELIAPAPEAAFADFPADVPLRGAPLL